MIGLVGRSGMFPYGTQEQFHAFVNGAECLWRGHAESEAMSFPYKMRPFSKSNSYMPTSVQMQVLLH